MRTFRQLLQRHVAPRLSALDYQYDDRLRDRSIMYGFQKHLGEDVHAVVHFQRHQHEEQSFGYGFTVDLQRGKTADFKNWEQYENSLWARLGHILWFVYRLRVYESYEHWWEPANAQECEAQLLDAVEKLEQYGIPWLEDPSSRVPWETPASKRTEFREAVTSIASPELKVLGYDLRILSQGNFETLYFLKHLDSGLNAFIEFQQIYLLDPPRFEIDALLQRKTSYDPHEVNGRYYSDWLHARLGDLLWYGYSVYPTEFVGWEAGHREEVGQFVPVQVPPLHAFNWKYADRVELEKQIRDITDKLKRYAIPWLEDPGSKNPR